ncbi:tail fiber protein [Boseaceae bacterium BT-24-1]|nr:tail fiber protein [Boseaceae bacterium BT-24-1]
MASTFTPNRAYDLMGTGDRVNTWGPPLNANFSVIDSNISASLPVALSSSNVTLNATQAQNLVFVLSGTLSANVSVLYPQVGGFFIVSNGTTGSFSVTIKSAAVGSVGVVIAQGSRQIFYSSGTEIYRANTFNETPTGTIADFGGPNIPAGWLLCDGSAISRTTYAPLFTVIGTWWGGGNGTTTFNIPDLRGRVKAGRDDMGGSTAGRLTSAGSGISGITLGTAGGAQNITLTYAELPVFTPTGTVFVTYPAQGYLIAIGGTSYLAGSSAAAFNGYNNASTSPPSGQNFVLELNQIGGGSAHNNVQPTAIVNSIIKI